MARSLDSLSVCTCECVFVFLFDFHIASYWQNEFGRARTLVCMHMWWPMEIIINRNIRHIILHTYTLIGKPVVRASLSYIKYFYLHFASTIVYSHSISFDLYLICRDEIQQIFCWNSSFTVTYSESIPEKPIPSICNRWKIWKNGEYSCWAFAITEGCNGHHKLIRRCS